MSCDVLITDDATFETLKDLVVEATAMALVGDHNHIVSLLAICLDPQPCIAMEYCELGISI